MTVRVDDVLLGLCNRAWDEAERQGAPRVEIGHVVWCLTVAAGASAWFERAGVSRATVSLAVDRWLAQAERANGSVALQTSGELKTLLTRAEQIAEDEARQFAGPRDFLTALMRRSSDLVSAGFFRGEHDARHRDDRPGNPRPRAPDRPDTETATSQRRYPIDTRPARWVQGELPLERGALRRAPVERPRWPDDETADHEFSARVHDHDRAHDRAGAAGRHGERQHQQARAERAYDPEKTALRDRLERQEHEVAELRSLIARLLDRRQNDGATEGTSGRPVVRGWRSRLRRRVCGSSLQHAGTSSNSSGSGQAHGTGHSAAENNAGQHSQAGQRSPRRAAADEPRQRYRVVRDHGHESADAVHALPDNDVDDDGDVTGDVAGDRMKRFYLSPDDDVVKAPSIGLRTAARLKPAGLVLVRDLLACDPAEVATRTGARYITADRIAGWKAQARLVCTIPWLRGTHAQLLVGAGFDTICKLMRADASVVCAAILRFVATREGQSILRSGPPPEIDRIACWIENTALAEPARAA